LCCAMMKKLSAWFIDEHTYLREMWNHWFSACSHQLCCNCVDKIKYNYNFC
jgi:hypothetical protein